MDCPRGLILKFANNLDECEIKKFTKKDQKLTKSPYKNRVEKKSVNHEMFTLLSFNYVSL